VLLADGSKRPIAALTVGDRVWSADPNTGHTSAQPVQAVQVDHDTDLLDLTITNPFDVTSTIHTTAKHPFYSPLRALPQTTGDAVTELANTTTPTPVDTQGWVNAADLHPGDQLATPFPDGTAHVASHTQVPGTADMWDLTIATTHTFYITTPTAAVLVHNCPFTPGAPGQQFSMGDVPKSGAVYHIRDAQGTSKYVGQSIKPPARIRTHIRDGKFDPDAGDTIDFPHLTNDRDALNGLEYREMRNAGTRRPSRVADNPGYNGVGLNKYRVYDPDKNPEAAARYEAAADRHLASQQNPVSRPSSPTEQRLNQQAQAESRTEQQRSAARDSAHTSGQSAHGGEHQGASSKSGSHSEKKPKKQSTNKKQRKGQK
jgi:hypothetical protein